MTLSRISLLTAVMTLAAAGAIAEVPADMLASSDPLMPQITRRQLTQNNGGVTGAVRLGSGQAIALNLKDAVADIKALGGLRPVKDLAPTQKKPGKLRKAHRAREQLSEISAGRRELR